MRCRSESVKRTVVDLSFSFFITLNSCNRTIGLSLPESSQGSEKAVRRYLLGIALRRISSNIASQ